MALWPIHRDDGAPFSPSLYKAIAMDLKNSTNNPKCTTINLALAMQKAVLVLQKQMGD